MAVDANGVNYVNIEGTLPTYSATAFDYNPYATATDMVVLQNPATSTAMLRVTQINVSGDAQSASSMDIYVYVRSALNTGGTSSAITAAKLDSNNPTPQGVTKSYSAAPTLNGTGGLVVADRIVLPGNNPAVAGTILMYNFGQRGGAQAIHLRPGEQLSINNKGNAVPTATNLYITIEWTESVGSSPVQ
jgi:hypothetical protein